MIPKALPSDLPGKGLILLRFATSSCNLRKLWKQSKQARPISNIMARIWRIGDGKKATAGPRVGFAARSHSTSGCESPLPASPGLDRRGEISHALAARKLLKCRPGP
jgi:hypothetical protein